VRCETVLRSVIVLGLLLVSGCSSRIRTPVEYKPVAGGVDDPLTTVQLELVDARELDNRAIDPAEIGSGRGLFGNTIPLYEAASHSVRYVTRDATADALRLARVGVSDHGPRTLVATVKKFWIDGYLGYKATVTVQCDLRDEQGNVLWTSVMTGEGGGVNWAGPDTFVRATFQRALTAYVQKAGGEFNSPEFQRYLF
jgi:hypothetical protein